jgi:hypothetical protein
MGAVIDAVNDTYWTAYGPYNGTYSATSGGGSQVVPADAIYPHSGYTMNVTIDKNLPGSIQVLQDDKRVPKMIFGSNTPDAYGTMGASVSSETFLVWLVRIDDHVTAYSPLPQYSATQNNNLGFGATLLWNKNITVPLPGKNYTWSIGGVSYDDQVFILQCKQTVQSWGYSLKDGSLLWGPTPAPFDYLDYYGVGTDMYYGKVLSCGYGGTLYAYDAQTGALVWNYNDTAPAYESPYGDNYPLSIGAVCDGKVYLYSTEHSPTKPLWRPYLICLNITDGTEIWKLLDYNMGLGIADGHIVTASQFDNNIYCIGKGPSATTVDAPMTAVTAGSDVVIRGTVTDQSPGAKGTPAIADADMQAWMEYLYEQQAKPTDAKGVEVSIDAVDPNGNYIHIGTATSDISGAFGYAWTTPDVPGTYQIIATFAGSNSYGGSFAQTYMSVGEAPPATAPSEYPQPIDNTMTIIAVGIAIIIAMVLIGIWIRRK